MLSSLVLCSELSVSSLCSVSLQRLASLLDPPHPRGSDWCVLGVKLGLQLLLPALDKQPSASPTAALLHAFGQGGGTLGALVRELRAMEREDAALVVMCSSPLYQVAPAMHDPMAAMADSPLVSATSSTNLSR